MPYRIIPVTQFEQNCTLVWCDKTGKGAVIDPGGDLDMILAAAKQHNVSIEKILLTHAHIDHAGGTAELAEKLNVPIEGPHEGDQFWIDGLPQQAKMFGFREARTFKPTRWLHDGDKVSVGEIEFAVRHCPGHTPGHVIFFDADSKLAVVGDVLFAGSIGRTDFPGGNFETLVKSIRNQLFTLGDEVQFIPGHGPMSTMGEERLHNPFVSDSRFG